MKRDMAHATEAPVSSRFLTSSNLLSILRALLVIPFLAVMLSDVPHSRLWGGLIILFAALTDKLDGMLARKFNEITEWGKILDPLADKIGVAAVALVLFWLGDIPSWFLLALLGRDLLIFSGGMYLKSRFGIVAASNLMGKWTIGVVSIALFAGVLHAGEPWMSIFIGMSTVMLLLSLGSYLMRFLTILKEQREGPYGNS
jgi:CDP-diacylglycerol--glycerol-3-phosphate 3-phosphatidyltransferase